MVFGRLHGGVSGASPIRTDSEGGKHEENGDTGRRRRAAICAVVGPSVSHAADQLRFVMVSHIGSNDPNMGWLTTSLKTFEQKYPDVKTEYVSTTDYSVQKHIQLLEQVIASKPDGIAVPIVDSKAF
jgi:simple sugar transport system substrate-binding protein